MTAKHRAAVEALKAWAIEANQNDPEGLALACQALDAAFGDHDAEAQAFFTMLEQTARRAQNQLATDSQRHRPTGYD
jgi:hypothetical protein